MRHRTLLFVVILTAITLLAVVGCSFSGSQTQEADSAETAIAASDQGVAKGAEESNDSETTEGASSENLRSVEASGEVNASVSGDANDSAATEGANEGAATQLGDPAAVPEDSQSSDGETSDGTSLDEAKILIVYYSRSGHTECIAQEIESHVDADVFVVEPEVPYTDNTDELSGIATREKNEDARPAIVGTVSNMDEYDVIFLGYPCWWSDMPMIMYTFLEQYSFDGKTIIPFTSYGESVWGRSLDHIEQVVPTATLLEGYATQEHSMENLSSDVAAWLNDLGF